MFEQVKVNKKALEVLAARTALFQKAEAALHTGDKEWAARFVDEAHDLVNIVLFVLEQGEVEVPAEVTDAVVQKAFQP